MGAALAMARALGIDALIAAELLPEIEAVMVRKLNEQMEGTVALRMNGAIVLPQQRKRHAGALEFTVDLGPIRLRLDKPTDTADRVEQQRFQLSVRHLRSKGPGERSPFDTLQILTGRALPDAKARRDLPGRQSAGVKSPRFFDLPHRQSLHGATCSG
jgi:hypothetical protein